jgi:hypothetical protein
MEILKALLPLIRPNECILKEEWFWAMLQFFTVVVSFIFIARQLVVQTKANAVQADAYELQAKANALQADAYALQAKANLLQADSYAIQANAHVIQTLGSLHSRWNSEAMIRSRLKVCSDWLDGGLKLDGADEFVSEFLEELGLYFQMAAVPDKVLWSTMSWYVENYFHIFLPHIKKMRRVYKDELFYANFERMYMNMKEISVARESPLLGLTKKQLRLFAEKEKTLALELLRLLDGANRNL